MKKIITLIIFTSFIYHYTCAQCITKVATGQQHTLALRADGSLWAWGSNTNGQLGDGTVSSGPEYSKNSPVKAGTATWKAISAGEDFSVGIQTNGTLWAWGLNDASGRLGDGSTGATNKSAPVKIADGNYVSVSAGRRHSLAIDADGYLWAWGYNFDGSLGNGTSGSGTNKNTPTKIGSDKWIVVVAGNDISYGIKEGGTLWAWGYSAVSSAEPRQHSSIPVQIASGTWRTIAGNRDFRVGIKSDGTLWAWGHNNFGQLGCGTNTAYSADPTQIGADNTWTDVTTGLQYCIALKSDGTLWSWGYNNNGQLGDGTNSNRNAPARVGSALWATLGTGSFSNSTSFGLQQNEELWAWGFNSYGQLGNGNSGGSAAVNTPVFIPAYNNILAANGSQHTITSRFASVVFNSNCDPIAAIQQPENDPNSVNYTGSVTAKVWVQTTPPLHYVKRHYQITPTDNAANATAQVTLYFTQEDFDRFNDNNMVKLPIGPTDAAGYKANLLVEKRSGSSTDNTGLPGSYPGSTQTINPNDANIVWNAAYSRWEVSFTVTGFSGFFIKTQTTALPVGFGHISAIVKNGDLLVNFATLTEQNNDRFIIEASADGKNFKAIGTLQSAAAGGNADKPLHYGFSITANDAGIASIMSLGLLMLLCFAGQRNRKLLAGAAVLYAFAFISCNKTVQELQDYAYENIYIRIVQVDKDGKKAYSRIVKVVKA